MRKHKDKDEEEEGEEEVVAAAVGKRIEEEEEEEEVGMEEEGEEEEEDGGAIQLEDSADCFFESLDRVPSGVSLDFDLPSSGSSSDDDEDDVRISFASAVGAPSFRRMPSFSDEEEEDGGRRGVPPVGGASVGEHYDYEVWMAEPISVKERRRKLLQGMGLASRKEVPAPLRNKTSQRIPYRTRSRLLSSRLLSSRLLSSRFTSSSSSSITTTTTTTTTSSSSSSSSSSCPSTDPIPAAASVPDGPTTSTTTTTTSSSSTTAATTTTVARSQSDSQLFMMRNPAATTGSSFQRRSSSLPSSFERVVAAAGIVIRGGEGGGRGNGYSTEIASPGSCKIKNLDTGKEFVVSEKDGAVDRVNDGQTGLQLTMEEFEKFLGFSPIVKELMRRANLIGSGDKDKKKSSDNDITPGGATAPSKSSSNKHSSSNGGSSSSSRKRGGWLKNIKFVASSVTGLISDKERENNNNNNNNNASSSERMKVHQHGKSYKELTGLYMCQEIQAHQGSIWTIKFSWDSRYLATAGEDRSVHVWEVLECDTLSSPLRCQDPTQSFAQKPPLPNGSSTQSSKKTKKGRGSSANRKNSLPDYIVMPKTVFSLSQKPVCSFEGHLDDVLDLSWSKSQYLLSSSMDKTVRLWDMETKACLKLFAHNDYVTCIQFNPIDDRYFISGSLDAKVRIWSIPDRHVVDWTDLHEMVTAACYTPDGQGALVGSHKGSCRFYNTSDCKLCQEGQIDIQNKKRKSNAKKITGFQFAPDNPSEVLITSADSQIRVFNGVDMIHKFRGFRNTSSQISASCSLDGKYVVCASEDSHVYIWKRDATRNASAGGKSKGWLTTRSHEHFYCKDVSVATPWPCGGSNYEPSPSLPSWSRRHTEDLPSNLEYSFSSSRSHQCPPLPKKSFSGELHDPYCSGSGIGSSSSVSSSASLRSRSGAASSFSSSATSSLSSWGWGGNSNRISSGLEAANAWGLVVVTAGLGGNIRVYQNFGMPLRLSRQPNLF